MEFGVCVVGMDWGWPWGEKFRVFGAKEREEGPLCPRRWGGPGSQCGVPGSESDMAGLPKLAGGSGQWSGVPRAASEHHPGLGEP